jgi:hypothetical protein
MLYESIKNKNFLSLYNSIDSEEKVDQLLNDLRNIPSDYFTSYDHYQYYKRYVLPKLKLIGKEYPWKSKVSPYREYKFRHLLVISLCEKYLALDFITSVYQKYKDSEDNYYRILNNHDHVFILGFNSDNKLFVNEIPNSSLPFRSEENKVFDNKAVEIRIINYGDMISGLGFDCDVADKENIIVSREGRYRVQGEITLRVDRELQSIEDFYRLMVDRSQIVDYVETYIANYMALALIDLGFSIESNRSITLRNVLPSKIVEKPNKIMNILRSLGDSIINELRKYIEVDTVVISEEKDYDSDIYFVEYSIVSSLGLFHLRVSFDYFKPRPFQSNYSDIIVSVRIDTLHEYEYCIMCKEIERELIDNLRNTPRQNIKLLYGNHLIELRNVYSGNITFRPSRRLEIELIRLPTIVYGIGYYYVDNESEIEITHKEHGVTKIRFEKPFLINLLSTLVLDDYIEKSNRIVLENIANFNNNNKKTIDYIENA